MSEYSITTMVATEQLGCTDEELAMLVRYNALNATFSKETGEVLIVVDDAYSKILKSKATDVLLEAIDSDTGRASVIGHRIKIINGMALCYARGDQRTPYRVLTPTKYLIRFSKHDDALNAMLNNNNFTQRSFMVKKTADAASYIRFSSTQARDILQFIPDTSKYKYIRQKLKKIIEKANETTDEEEIV